MAERVLPAPGTPGFEVGTITKCFNPDGSPVPDSRNDGAPLQWYDGKFWFESKEDAEGYLAEFHLGKERRNSTDGYSIKEWVVKEGVPLFGGMGGF